MGIRFYWGEEGEFYNMSVTTPVSPDLTNLGWNVMKTSMKSLGGCGGNTAHNNDHFLSSKSSPITDQAMFLFLKKNFNECSKNIYREIDNTDLWNTEERKEAACHT